MFARVLIAVAVAVYLTVMGCVLIPGEEAVNRPNPVSSDGSISGKRLEQSFRGVAMTVRYADDMKPYHKCVDEIADAGADTLEVVVDTRQENGSSTTIWIDQRYTPSKPQLLELFAHAKKRGLKIVLMPVVLPHAPKGQEWRGTFAPDSWDQWFDSYRVMLRHFSEICEEGKADVLVVGSELVSSEEHDAEWKKTISTARKHFPSGMLTYSANWDHYAKIRFWEQLDFIGMNSYWKLGPDKDSNVSVEEIMKRWASIQKELVNFSNAKGKPIVLLEVGWCSISNASWEPWDYTKTELRPDWDLQKRLYEGFFRSWHGNPNLGGFMIWEWLPTGDVIERDDKTYIPKGKPAYDVLKQWLGKGSWKVQ